MTVATFFTAAIALSWAAWLPAASLSAGVADPRARLLLYVGGLGPVAATLLALRSPRARQGFTRRLGVAHLASRAGVLALLMPFAIGTLALFSAGLLGRDVQLAPARRLGSLALPLLLFGPLPEELAWRGYALPALLQRLPPRPATLILGLVWCGWHLPLFFITGTYQETLGLTSLAGALFFLNLLVQSVILTALLLATGSTWSAVAFHWTTNLVGEWLRWPLAVEVHRTGWTLAAGVIAFLLIGGPRRSATPAA